MRNLIAARKLSVDGKAEGSAGTADWVAADQLEDGRVSLTYRTGWEPGPMAPADRVLTTVHGE
jgi:hypothetical protein